MIDKTEFIEDCTTFPELVGKMVESVECGKDRYGDPLVVIKFTDATSFMIQETSQSGSIKAHVI